MSITPLRCLTDAELLQGVFTKDAPTDIELELADRLDYTRSYINTLLEELHTLRGGAENADT